MISRTQKIVVLVSGGMDSAVLLDWACRRFERVIPVYVRCGMRWETAELFWLRRYLRRAPCRKRQMLRVLHMPVADLYQRHWSVVGSKQVPGYRSRDEAVFLPGRNLLFLSKVSVFCYSEGVGNIALGTLAGNPFLDSRAQFFRAFEESYREALGPSLKIRVPFRTKKKSAVLRLGRCLPLELTFSCLNPRCNAPCGRCNKCAERARVLKNIA